MGYETKKKKKMETEKGKTYVCDEGPRRGFSFMGWKENLPKKSATQESELLGQSLTYMVMINTTTLATTKAGISQANHFLKRLISR